MSDTAITERQQYWLDHIRAAEAFDGSVADYARSEGLKPKELYSWKGILARRGFLSVPAPDENSGGFVRVIAPARRYRSSTGTRSSAIRRSLTPSSIASSTTLIESISKENPCAKTGST